MPQPLKFTRTAQQRKAKRPWAAMPVEIERKARALIDEGVKHCDIAKQLKIHKSSVHRVAQRMRAGTTIDNPKKPDYRKILAEAREYREKQLAEMRAKRVSETNGRGTC